MKVGSKQNLTKIDSYAVVRLTYVWCSLCFMAHIMLIAIDKWSTQLGSAIVPFQPFVPNQEDEALSLSLSLVGVRVHRTPQLLHAECPLALSTPWPAESSGLCSNERGFGEPHHGRGAVESAAGSAFGSRRQRDDDGRLSH